MLSFSSPCAPTGTFGRWTDVSEVVESDIKASDTCVRWIRCKQQRSIVEKQQLKRDGGVFLNRTYCKRQCFPHIDFTWVYSQPGTFGKPILALYTYTERKMPSTVDWLSDSLSSLFPSRHLSITRSAEIDSLSGVTSLLLTHWLWCNHSYLMEAYSCLSFKVFFLTNKTWMDVILPVYFRQLSFNCFFTVYFIHFSLYLLFLYTPT